MSCQDVCVRMDYDGGNAFYHEKVHRARKAYKCVECGDVINPGDRYEYASGKSYDTGSIFSARTCLPCAEIRGAFCCDGWVFGEMWEAIREQVFPRWNEVTAIDCLAKLTTDAAITSMRAEYAQYREDWDS